MVWKRFLIICICFLLFIPINFVNAYKLKCNISPTPYPYEYDKFVTTKSFTYSIEIESLENDSYPGANVEVKVHDPNNIVVEPSKKFSIPVLNQTNKSYKYTPPWSDNKDQFQLYDTDKIGTWKIETTIIALDNQQNFIESDSVTRVNKCIKSISVIDINEYEQIKKEESIKKEPTKEEDKNSIEITIAWMLFLTLLTLVGTVAIYERSWSLFIIGTIISLVVTGWLYQNHLLLVFWERLPNGIKNIINFIINL